MFGSPAFFYAIMNFMETTIQFNNLAKAPLRKGFFAAVARNVFAGSDFDFLKEKNVSIGVALVSEAEIKRLNREYRRKNRPTDVLSFAEFEKTAKIREVKDNEIYLGELVLCYADIRKYARTEKKNLEKELVAVVAHGMLHLMGLRHGKKMFALQEKASKSIIRKIWTGLGKA